MSLYCKLGVTVNMLTAYGLGHCTTSQKAIKIIETKGKIVADKIDIRENPPSEALIRAAIQQFDNKPRKIMNTSGELYRQLGLKDKLDGMELDQIVELLAENGMLIKRPFVTDGHRFSVGAREKDLDLVWKNS